MGDLAVEDAATDGLKLQKTAGQCTVGLRRVTCHNLGQVLKIISREAMPRAAMTLRPPLLIGITDRRYRWSTARCSAASETLRTRTARQRACG